MNVTKNRVVTLTYALHHNNLEGNMIETVDANEPAVFLFGTGSLLPEFEQNLEGKTIGDQFEFSIAAANAYGETDDQAMEYVPKDIFMIDGQLADDMLEIDQFINLRDHEGNLVRAKVLEVAESEVLLDFNHPLAGTNLFFKGTIISVREATEEEMNHGHVHGKGGHEH